MATPAEEWRDAFRRARNAWIAWAVIGAAALAVSIRLVFDTRPGAAAFMVIWFAGAAVLYGLWRLARLVMIRRDLSELSQPLGQVYVALVDSPIHRNIHELVLVWFTDPRIEGGRLRRPDRTYMADFSEDDHTDAFHNPVVRQAWTPVRPDGRPRRGRWFHTEGNLILTVRRGGPFAWLATVRGFRTFDTMVPAEQPDPSGFVDFGQPIGFAGLRSALLWRLLGSAALGTFAWFFLD